LITEKLIVRAFLLISNFRLAKFLTSRHVRMHRVIFYIPNTLRKLMIRA